MNVHGVGFRVESSRPTNSTGLCILYRVQGLGYYFVFLEFPSDKIEQQSEAPSS